MSYIERLENHIIDMYKNNRIEAAEFTSIKDLINNIKGCIYDNKVLIDKLKTALESLLELN